MNRSLGSLLLWLFVINLGIAFGAGLYESRILVPPLAQRFARVRLPLEC